MAHGNSRLCDLDVLNIMPLFRLLWLCNTAALSRD